METGIQNNKDMHEESSCILNNNTDHIFHHKSGLHAGRTYRYSYHAMENNKHHN